MKKMITLIALIAVLALMSTGCSESNSPLSPVGVSAIDFPAEGNGGGEQAAQPAAPHSLKAEKFGNKVNLSWKHSSMDASWYRVYCAESASGFSLIQTTQGLDFTDTLDADAAKLKYRVTAVNAQGVESPFSEAVAVYGGGKGEPEQEIGQDDVAEQREGYVKAQSFESADSEEEEDESGGPKGLPNEQIGQDDIDEMN